MDYRNDNCSRRRLNRALEMKADIVHGVAGETFLRELTFHHIGYLVLDISAAASKLVRSFGYSIESEVIEDKTQTAHVQFLRQPGSPFWIELITPNGSGSKLAGALQKGIVLHHLCYEANTLEKTSEKLRNDGFLQLSAPMPAEAFVGRRITWLMDRTGFLVELVEAGGPPFSVSELIGTKE